MDKLHIYLYVKTKDIQWLKFAYNLNNDCPSFIHKDFMHVHYNLRSLDFILSLIMLATKTKKIRKKKWKWKIRPRHKTMYIAYNTIHNQKIHLIYEK